MYVSGLKSMDSALAWQPVVVEVFYQLAAQRAAPKSLLNNKNNPLVLPKPNRLRVGSEFNLVTKTGSRFTSENLVIYVLVSKSNQSQAGLIVNRSVGGSVVRHLVSRKLRHNLATQLPALNQNLMLVVRVLKQSKNYTPEINELFSKINFKFSKNNKADV